MAKTLNFANAFPDPAPGMQRGPLPKQQEFLDRLLDQGSPKFVRYVGGVGSGKTLIGCISTLLLATMYPGDYLVARQFMPELRDTTLKTFLEVIQAVGPELMIEHRVADAVIRVRSRGGVSNVLFRGLEEPDKLRSLNLNAFYIDEAAQVSEAAFMLLQGRLRGRHVRKGFLTQNSGGMDWTYRWFTKKDHLKTDKAKAEFYSIKAPSTENVHLPEGYVETMLASWSEERIRREIYADESAFEGAVYPEFRQDVHVIKPFKIPDDWTRVVGADHGLRNPSAWVWGAVDYDGNLFIYREFYKKEWLIEETCNGKVWPDGKREPGVMDLMKSTGFDETTKLQGVYIDPSTRARRGSGKSDYDIYLEHLPAGVPLIPANNDKTAGIDRVKSYLKIDSFSRKPRVFIFNNCTNLIEELASYRYEETPAHLQGRKNDKEEPRKVNDHACFVAGTLISTISGEVPIENVRPGDLVHTTLGPRRVLAAGSTGVRPVVTWNGLTGTADHPVLLANGLKKPLGDLTPTDTPVKFSEWRSDLTALRIAKWASTIEQMARSVGEGVRLCIERFGYFIKALFPRTTTFTTATATPTITPSKILSVFPRRSISHTTPSPTHGLNLPKDAPTCKRYAPLPRTGIGRLPGGNGIGNMLGRLLRRVHSVSKPGYSVASAETPTLCIQISPINQSTVTSIADKKQSASGERVYSLAVEGISEYFANGILVSNCDAFRYLLMSQPEAPSTEETVWDRVKYDSLEGRLVRDLKGLKDPKIGDPFRQGF